MPQCCTSRPTSSATAASTSPGSVRTDGDWEAWLKFFFRGVTDTATAAADTAESIQELRGEARSRLSEIGGGKLDLAVLDALYRQPLVKAKWDGSVANVVPATANMILSRLEQAGILREITGRKRDRVFRYDAYLARFDQPTTDIEADETGTEPDSGAEL